ncbi:MAG: transcriptional regulator [Gammaproteobacteria bacterium]|nr:transcriptional regulator [Gammaproteobacteria bacterium]|tara:strand:+ start:1514 stop:1777 length:264 start_codon:yes stop_codon:yes gene_type:complete
MIEDSLIDFPCKFPIKIMGRDTQKFRNTVHKLVEKHAGPIDKDSIKINLSDGSNFVAMTITITASSQQQLDDIYQDVSSHNDVLIAL